MITKSGIAKDFFTLEEEKTLRDLIETNRTLDPGSSRYAPFVIESMSRVQIEFAIPENIKEQLIVELYSK